MKRFMVVAGTMAMVVLAQSGLDSLPLCGQTCFNNMRMQYKQLGCNMDDWSCLCMKQNFLYGIRDCTNEYCKNENDAADTQTWGNSLCAAHGVSISTNQVATTVQQQTNTGAAAETSGGNSVAIVSTFTTVVTSGDNVVTSTGVATFTGTVAVNPPGFPLTATPSNGGGATATATGDNGGTGGENGTAGQSGGAKSKPTQTGGGGEEPKSSGSSTETSDNPAIRATAAPMGILAVAGMAAFLI